jgi:two-component system, cell cycle response regulator
MTALAPSATFRYRYGQDAVTKSTKSVISCPHDDAGCSLAIEFAELRERVCQLEASARIDALTGFYNYRHLMEALATEMERTRRTGIHTALIMTDLDHFKKINDTYGHEAGNAALKQAARLWQNAVRQVDIACRYGGEEFVFILPGTRFSMAVRAAERLRLTLAETPLQLNEAQVKLTASFGVAAYRSDQQLDAAGFIDRADQYVLKAKAAGRNRVAYDRSQLACQETSVSASEKALLTRLASGDADAP